MLAIWHFIHIKLWIFLSYFGVKKVWKLKDANILKDSWVPISFVGGNVQPCSCFYPEKHPQFYQQISYISWCDITFCNMNRDNWCNGLMNRWTDPLQGVHDKWILSNNSSKSCASPSGSSRIMSYLKTTNNINKN